MSRKLDYLLIANVLFLEGKMGARLHPVLRFTPKYPNFLSTSILSRSRTCKAGGI